MDQQQNLQDFSERISSLLREIEHEEINIRQDQNRCEFYANRLQAALSHLCSIGIYLERENHPFPEERVQLRRLRDNVRGIYEHIYSLPIMGSYCYRPDLEQTGQRGRPRFRINADQLQFLRSEFNSWTEVAADLGVSRQTVYNRRRELGFSLDFEGFSNITNDDLDSIVRDELSAFPRTGETNLIGGLRSRGIYVQRWRVRQSIVRVDPINRANRWGERIVRRPYSVPHPNFLWHMDTNMKLRHWRLCIHGCVDGYSRSIIYLRLNNNNRATTVLNCFQTATRSWGHPSRVRADDGGENIAVGEYMEWYRGANRGSFITGPSVRNTRIERLWRDIGEGVISVFSSLFRHLEVQGIHNPNLELDIFALHFVYVPRIQRSLDRFSERFSYHSLSTEGNRTPRQLLASGCLQNYASPNSGVRDVFDTHVPDDLNLYGYDPQAPLPDPDNEVEGVNIPEINFEIPQACLTVLRNQFNPLENDLNFGIDTYVQVRTYLLEVIRN